MGEVEEQIYIKSEEKLLLHNTGDKLIQCMIECIDQWFESGVVCPTRHPEAFAEAV